MTMETLYDKESFSFFLAWNDEEAGFWIHEINEGMFPVSRQWACFVRRADANTAGAGKTDQ